MIDPQVFTDQYLAPAATELGILDTPHLQIGLGTGLQESGLQIVRQRGGGPALGPFQMEPTTHDSLWANFIKYKPKLQTASAQILGLLQPSAEQMMEDPIYAAFMMYVKYLDCPGAIPEDLQGQAAYYKKFYNTPLGAATEEEYIQKYTKFAAHVTFNA